MLCYYYSPPFFSFQISVERNPYDWRIDTLRYLHYNITISELTYHTCIRELEFKDDLVRKYEGTIEDYRTMICALRSFRKYLTKNVEYIDILQMIETKIELNDSKELSIITFDRNLREFVENECSKEGTKLRTIHPQVTTT